MRELFSRFFGKRNQFRRCNGFAIFASVTCLDQDMEDGAEFYRRFVRIEEVMRQSFESAKPSQHGRAMASFKIVWENCELEERTKQGRLLGVQTGIVKFLRPESAWKALPVDNQEMSAVLLTAEELDQLVESIDRDE